MSVLEANFDGLVGPTHNYAGLALGNVASQRNRASPSNPREAALQGLAKMRAMAALGLPQGLIPPHERPHLPTLRRLGFSGSDAQVLARAAREAPDLLVAVSSASAMWTANAATVSPSADTADGRVHFTPANLCANLHRSIEPATTARLLAAIFPPGEHFAHHPPLPATPDFGDEGAANHTRLCPDHAAPGVELFVYGRAGGDGLRPRRFPARHTRMASEAVARLHGLDPARAVFVQQDPEAIDAGVFHNDVIAVGDRDLLLLHERAFVDTDAVIARLEALVPGLITVRVPAARVSLAQAVDSYLFNSQIVGVDPANRLLVVAQECREIPAVWEMIQDIVADPGNPITEVRVFDLRQSMRNGGGPACLRLRVALDPAQRAAVNPACWIDEQRATALEQWVCRHYRDRLHPDDLADPALLDESRKALDELTRMLGLGSVYDFQRV